jgi:hypothetical protein
MRTFSRCLLVAVVVALSAGPVVAAPRLLQVGPGLSPPAPAPAPTPPAWPWLLYSLAVLGAIKIKDTGTLAQKFITRASAASGEYRDGVAAAGADWQTNTANAEANFEQGVQQSIADKRFGKGVVAAGAAKYTARATTLGATRYAPGVNASKDDWAKGVQPYLDTLKNLTLPPKGPRRSPQNMARVNVVDMALAAQKVGR